MEKKFKSNSQESVRMFKSGLLESLSKVHFTVPIFVYGPVIIYGFYRAFSNSLPIAFIPVEILSGLFIWTFTEYVMHRYLFHFIPPGKIGERLHFVFHGVHHDYPSDKGRLVMPPSLSISLATGFYFLYKAILPSEFVWGFFAAFLTGYLIYDIGHYAIHHFNFKSGIFKKIKQHHMLHHYQEQEKGYGVSSPLWDRIFNSGFKGK
jgi:sterol desaturase/sphingolipid hydroxylase (fatty acid hydroxylase superfamily)